MTRREAIGAGSRLVSVLRHLVLLAAYLAPAAIPFGFYVYFQAAA